MTLTINGERRVLPDDTTLFHLLHQDGESDRGKAAAVDGRGDPPLGVADPHPARRGHCRIADGDAGWLSRWRPTRS